MNESGNDNKILNKTSNTKRVSLFNLHTFNSNRRFICFFLQYYDMEKNKNSLSVNLMRV